jgi:hypothetical protein
MRVIGFCGLFSAALVAFGAVAVASASAEKFIVSGTGLKFTGKATSTQIFTDKSGATPIECTEVKPEGSNETVGGTEEKVNTKYEGCKASIASASISTAFYTFLTNGSTMGVNGVSILTTPITITVAALKCKIVVAAGQTFAGTGEIAYSNNTASTIEVKSKVTGIASEVTEAGSSLCGKAGEKNTTGTYTGSGELGLQGGTLQIK